MSLILVLIIIGVPWLGAALILLDRDRHDKLQHSLAVLFALVAAAAAILLTTHASKESVLVLAAGTVFGDFTFVPDGLGVFLTLIATIIGSLAVIFSINYMHGEKGLGRYYAYVLFFIGAMSGLVLTSNMLLMFFFCAGEIVQVKIHRLLLSSTLPKLIGPILLENCYPFAARSVISRARSKMAKPSCSCSSVMISGGMINTVCQ